MGGQLGVKELRLQQFFVVVLLVFSVSPLTCNAYTSWTQNYQLRDLNALQAIWGAWNDSNEGTPDPSSNLAGWNASQKVPCNQYVTGNIPSWRGVQCLTMIGCETIATDHLNCSAYVIGLTLNNASIGGTLPLNISDIVTLTTLELTGNPRLTGPLPNNLQNTQLTTLDLHDNAFYGEIPNFLSFERATTVDLSGNRLNGSGPLIRLQTMKNLQKLNLGSNDFEGEIPELAFDNHPQLIQLDLSNNRFNGTLPTLTMIKNLQTLDMSNNSFSGTLPNLTTMSSLHTVDLSKNNLSGTLPALTMIKNLQKLNLSRNAFTGSILISRGLGSQLQELYLDFNLVNGTLNISELYSQGLLRTKFSSSSGLLRVLSVMNNTIDKVVYDGVNIEDVSTVFRLGGNPYCKNSDSDDGTRCFCEQICFNSAPMRSNDKRKVVIIVVVSSVTISLLVLLVSLAALLHRTRRYKRDLRLLVQQKFEEFEVKPTIFPYNQLRTATREFHPDMKLGQGAYGAVYKGILPNGSVVAVKQLFARTNQGIDEFLNEVVLLTGMKHRNLVNLKGCCIREQQRLLVYEYVDNHDIDHVLLAGQNKALLSWPVRLRICLGVARGLHYLHALAHPKIIHRDIKASNVLLTQNYETKIADFGLALLFPDEESYIMTEHVAGTKGYLAPEYASYGQLSDKVDVFSFGVLCLEVVSGRRNIDEKKPLNEIYLSKWAWELHRGGKLMDLIDSTISLHDEEKLEVQRLIKIALVCINSEAERRPSMERVVAMLQGDNESEVVVMEPGNEEQYLDSTRMIAVGQRGLATVMEKGESTSFINLSRSGAGCFEDDLTTVAMLELSETRVR